MFLSLVPARYTVGIVACVAMGLPCCSDCDSTNRYYRDFETAKAAGAPLTRGRLGKLVPKSATEIREAFIADTMDLWLRFRFAPENRGHFSKHCKETTWKRALLPDDPDLVSGCMGATDWWSTDLVRGRGGKMPKGYLVYWCGWAGEQKAYLAIDVQKNIAYYWEIRP